MNPPTDVGKKELAAHGVILRFTELIVQRYLVDNWVGAGEALLYVCVGFLTHHRAEQRKLSILFRNRHKVMNPSDEPGGVELSSLSDCSIRASC